MVFKYFDVESVRDICKDLKKEHLDSLVEWLNIQPHLPKMPEQQVILFLHSCYYNNEIAKNVIDTYFTIKTHVPEFFHDRTLKSIEHEIDVVHMCALPRLTPEGHKVLYLRLNDLNSDHFNFSNFLKKLDMIAMLYMHKFGPNNGHQVIIDLLNVSFGHVTKLGIMPMKKFLTYLQEAMPVRLKGLHFSNIVPFMDKILALMKPFMKKELIDMLYLHTDDFSTLYPFVPKHCLPRDYGGDNPSIAELHEEFKQLMYSNQEFFDDENKQFVDESKRPGKPKNAGDLFGVEGTFKKLDID